MKAFDYRGHSLCAESVPLEKIAAETGTPFYCYSAQQLRHNYEEFKKAFDGLNILVCYAIKANANKAVVRTLVDCGAGVDITSAGELERALNAGAAPEKIVFSGVGKSRDEISAAVLSGIHQINIESVPELHLVSEVAVEHGRTAAIAFRINPDVDAKTHKKLSTGHKATKFGLELEHLAEAVQLAASLPSLDFKGFSVHIGSHMYDYEPFRHAFSRLAETVRICREQGINVERIDLGGGVGIPYDGQRIAPFSEYASIVREIIAPLGCEVIFEPGRRLVGDAGVLVSRIIRVKRGTAKKFVIIDAAMNDLVRPAMYGARHSLIPVREKDETSIEPVTVVGAVCETSDLFGEDYFLPPLEVGDFVAIFQAGAYGSTMASTYNGRALVPEVMVSGDCYAVVRRRISVAEQISWEALPGWL